MGSLVERTILASFRYPLVARSVRGRSRWLGLLRAEVAWGWEEEEDGDQTLKHSRVPRSWAVGDGEVQAEGVRAEAVAAVEVTAELEAHWDGVLGGKRRISFLLVRSLCCVRDVGLTPVISSFSGTLTTSGDNWGEWSFESCVRSRRAGVCRLREEWVLWSRLVQLPSIGTICKVPYGEESEPCTSREHRSSEEQLWSGMSAVSDTIREALSTEAMEQRPYYCHIPIMTVLSVDVWNNV